MGQLLMKIFSCVSCAWVCVIYIVFNLPALLAIYNLFCDFFFIISFYFLKFVACKVLYMLHVCYFHSTQGSN